MKAPVFFILALAAETPAPGPPPTRVEPVRELIHGRWIVDDYCWLEGDDSDPAQMGRMTDEVARWTDAQNAYTRSVLDNLPGRKELEEALRPLMEVGSVSRPIVRGDRYFFSKREGKEDQPVVYWRIGYKGESRTLLDPARIDASGLTTVDWYSPSQDGKLVAYGTYRVGDENATLHLVEVDTGRELPLTIPNRVEPPDWLPDGSGFVYRNLDDAKNPYSGRVRFHRMGADPAGDTVLLRQLTPEEDRKLATTWGPGGSLSRDGRWLLLSYWVDTRSNDLWVADFDAFLRTGRLDKREATVGEAGTAFGDVVEGTLFLQTTKGAPNGRIVAVDPRRPDRASWREIVPERKDAVIEGLAVGKGVLAVGYLHDAQSRIEVFAFDGRPLGALRLPGIGSAEVTAEPDRTEAYVTFTSFNQPTTIYRVDLAHPEAEPELWERPAVPVDPSGVEVEQVFYPSKDGTRIGMFLVHRKGIVLDGQNPTLLTGYGGFDVSETPTFSAPLFQWLDAGGVFALANLRGGGEYGDAWHEAGMLSRKQNVFDDFIAAAEYLIAKKYTNPKRLAITGTSNGGLLTGAALVQRPDLYAAVVSNVPLLDMLRYQDFLMARYWVPEYGSAADPAQFEWLYAYSPYHHVKPGTHYPAVLLTAGENDPRVHPFHARKMAAALQAATAADPDRRPVLLWVDREAGHGYGKPLKLRIRDLADQRIFLMWQLGMLSGPGSGARSRPRPPARPRPR